MLVKGVVHAVNVRTWCLVLGGLMMLIVHLQGECRLTPLVDGLPINPCSSYTGITSYPGLHPDFISQLWRKAGAQTLSRSRGEKSGPFLSAFLHGCEIKSGWRPGYEVNTGMLHLEFSAVSLDDMACLTCVGQSCQNDNW